MSAISAVENLYISSAKEKAEAEEASKSNERISHDDFLMLLTAQLSNQDPLNPVQDQEFVSQMAQLQALDEQLNMTKAMEDMRFSTDVRAANDLVGKQVSGDGVTGDFVEGEVVGVKIDDGNVRLVLDNFREIEYASVEAVNHVAVQSAVAGSTLQDASALIGKHILGEDATGATVAGIVKYALLIEGQPQVELEYGRRIPLGDIHVVRNATDTDAQFYKTLADAGLLMGKEVEGLSTDGDNVSGIVAGAYGEEDTVYVKLKTGDVIAYGNITAVNP